MSGGTVACAAAAAEHLLVGAGADVGAAGRKPEGDAGDRDDGGAIHMDRVADDGLGVDHVADFLDGDAHQTLNRMFSHCKFLLLSKKEIVYAFTAGCSCGSFHRRCSSRMTSPSNTAAQDVRRNETIRSPARSPVKSGSSQRRSLCTRMYC